eukprot:8374881-Lingulodinium_polyedra.AAC.1
MAGSSTDSNAHPAARRISELSKGSACLTKQGSHDLSVACEAAKKVMGIRFNDLLKQSAGMPLLTSKSCDGTPMN